MDFVFGNLPDGIEKKDIKRLTQRFKPSEIKFLKNKYSEHSCYECMVSLELSNPVAAFCLEKQFNNFCWKGSRISFHRLIF
jgi:hypothetical protein